MAKFVLRIYPVDLEHLEFSIDQVNFTSDTFFLGLGADDYSLLVRDANNCLSLVTDTSIYAPDSIQFTYSVNDPACFDYTGSIEFDVPTGGSRTGWMFSIDSGMNFYAEALFEDIAVDTFYLMVKENMDCESAIVDTMFVIPDALTTEIDSMHNKWGSHDGFIAVTAKGGTKPYSWTVNSGSEQQATDSTFFYSTNVDGVYVVEVVDINGCGPISAGTLDILSGFETPSGLEAKVYPNPTSGSYHRGDAI